MARLTKRDVEQMMLSYDADPTAALLTALRIVLNDSQMDWDTAVRVLPAHLPREAIAAQDMHALDELLTYLAECRDLEKP
jgi:hypothetical protein